MYHSILIPHRNRNLHLEACLWSIQRSAEVCKRDDFEVLIVDDGSAVLPNFTVCSRARLIEVERDGLTFNKCRLLNVGIEQAGAVLTFLDADAIVGRRWMAGVDELSCCPYLTRLCYRVRALKEHRAIPVQRAEQSFNEWEKFPIRYEARVRPDTHREDGEPLFGNSQFSIRRDVLGDLRMNEEFRGGGYEDIWFIREIWRRYGAAYKARLMADKEHAMFHIHNGQPDQVGWRTPADLTHNRDLYYAT